MPNRLANILVIVTLPAVQLVWWSGTLHDTEVKYFLFVTVALVLLVLTVVSSLFGRRAPSRTFSGPLLKAALAGLSAYALLAGLSILWSDYRLAALLRFSEVALYVLWTLLVVTNLRTRNDLSRLLTAFFAGGVVVAGAAFAFHRYQGVQYLVPTGNPNWLASLMLLPMVLAAEGCCRNVLSGGPRRLLAVAQAGAFALMGVVLYLTASESAAVSLIAALVVLPLFVRARRRRVIVGILILLIAAAAVGDLTLRSPGKLRSFSETKSVKIRLHMWRWSLDLAKRNPVSGLGAGGFFPNAQTVGARDMNRMPGYFAHIVVHAHNEPLEVFVELGALGLAAFLLGCFAPVVGIARMPVGGEGDALRARTGALAAGWLAVFLHSCFTIGLRFWSVPVVFWTALAALIASLRLLREPKANDTSTPAGRSLLGRSFGACVGYVVALALIVGVVEYLLVVRGWRAAVAATVMTRKNTDLDEAGRLDRLRTATSSIFYVDRVRAHHALGRSCLSRGSYGAAMEEFVRVGRMAADYHDVELMIGITYLRQRRLREAVPHLLRHGMLKSADERTADRLARYLRSLEPAKAFEELRLIGEAYPESSKVHVTAGLLMLRAEPPNEDMAVRAFDEALKRNPDDAHANYVMGKLMLKRGQRARGYALLDRARENGLRNVALYLELARFAQAGHDPDRAKKLLEEAKELFPKSDRITEALEELK